MVELRGRFFIFPKAGSFSSEGVSRPIRHGLGVLSAQSDPT